MYASRSGGTYKVNTNPLILILQKIRGVRILPSASQGAPFISGTNSRWSPSQLTSNVPSNPRWQEEGSPLDTLQLQNELLDVCAHAPSLITRLLMGSLQSGLRNIFECLREAVNILGYMQRNSIHIKATLY